VGGTKNSSLSPQLRFIPAEGGGERPRLAVLPLQTVCPKGKLNGGEDFNNY